MQEMKHISVETIYKFKSQASELREAKQEGWVQGKWKCLENDEDWEW